MAQSILSRALSGPQPEARLRVFLSEARLGEIKQLEQALLDTRASVADASKPEDAALLRVCDRWLEIVQEYKLTAQ